MNQLVGRHYVCQAIDIKRISENRNVVSACTPEYFDGLRGSIAAAGFCNPITVRPINLNESGGPYYQVIDGSKRLQCAIKLGWLVVPAIVLIRSNFE